MFSVTRGMRLPQPPWVRRMRRTGIQGLDPLGLRGAGAAQRNGFTAAGTTTRGSRTFHVKTGVLSAATHNTLHA